MASLRRGGRGVRAKFMLPWTFSEEAAAAKHLAQLQHNMWVANAVRGPVDHHRGREVGRDKMPMPTHSIQHLCSPLRRSSGVACCR